MSKVGVPFLLFCLLFMSNDSHARYYDLADPESTYTEMEVDYPFEERVAPAPSPVAESCTIREVNGMIQQCCRQVGPYGAYDNCTVFRNTFHHICDQNDVECRSVGISCPNGPGHAVNQVLVERTIRGRTVEQWCLVEPQGRIIGCYADENNIPQNLVCQAMGLPANCGCTVTQNSEEVLPINTNPVTRCMEPAWRANPNDNCAAYRQCESCCRSRYNGFLGPNGVAQATEWLNDCIGV